MTQSIYTHTYANGLTLVAEAMDWLESAAFTFVLPSGCVRDPDSLAGLANFTCEMVQRGCGQRDSRQFVESLERLGVDRNAAVSISHTSFGAGLLAENLLEVLSIYAELVREPHLPEVQLEDARQVCLHEVRSVEDDPAQKVMQELRRYHYPHPWGRPGPGTEQTVRQITHQDVQQFFRENYHAAGAILAVAGRIDWPRLKDHIGEILQDWPALTSSPVEEKDTRKRNVHIPQTSSQTHIGIAYPSVPYGHEDYYQARGAVGVLSDGMSSRLFTEVRENRGLCYAVYALSHSLRHCGSVLCYAGTSTERAQETLDVLIHELVRLAEGILPEELGRLKARIKSGLVMQQESSAARSNSIAADWYYLGRVQSIDEIKAIVDGLSCESINSYLKANPPREFTVATLGETELEVPVAVL